MTTRPRETIARVTFDPEKTFRYTWPGQVAKVATGAELTELCKGADASMLAIEDVTEHGKWVPAMSLKETDELNLPDVD